MSGDAARLAATAEHDLMDERKAARRDSPRS